jgi:glucokinase
MEAMIAYPQAKDGMIAAVDIGGTKIAVGMIDDNGSVHSRLEAPTNPEQGYPNALERITTMLREAARTAGCEVGGIGIGSTGPVDPMSGTFGNVNFFPHWEGENPVRDLECRFNVSAAMENDADAAALGEAAWGAGQRKQRLIYVTVGTGIGAGLVFNGELYRGVDQAHPEIGHHLVDPSGPPCTCGFRGCWESLAAGPAMVEWFRANRPVGHPELADLTAKRICELARGGDALAHRAVEHEVQYLGLGLANLVTLFAPDAIVLGGSLMKSSDLFLPGIRSLIGQCCKYVPFEKTELALASLGEDANLIGAARVWHHRFPERGTSRA